MGKDKIKFRIEKLYSRYLSGEISKKEFDELFDLMRDESHQGMMEDLIDGTVLPYLESAGTRGRKEETTTHADKKIFGIRNIRPAIYRIAAVLLVLLGVLFHFFNDEEWVVYTTGYQETRTVDLPDGSIVILNANSELKYRPGMQDEDHRIVEFRGEGYFDVAHLEGRSFTVHTGSVDVNVLGTEFNLETRRDFTNVFLKEGKVVLKSEELQPVEMEPGDRVHYNQEKKEFNKVNDHASEALSWKEGVFTFSDLTGIQILHKMEDIYGKEFIVEHPGDLNDIIVVQGLPYKDWDFTREALELALDVRFEESDTGELIVVKK